MTRTWSPEAITITASAHPEASLAQHLSPGKTSTGGAAMGAAKIAGEKPPKRSSLAKYQLPGTADVST